jgi:hypothetical protein
MMTKMIAGSLNRSPPPVRGRYNTPLDVRARPRAVVLAILPPGEM